MIISKGSRGHQIRKWSLIPNEDPSVANCELQLYSMLCMETDRNCVSEAQNSRPYWIPDGALCWQGQVEVRTLKGSLVLPRHLSLSPCLSNTPFNSLPPPSTHLILHCNPKWTPLPPPPFPADHALTAWTPSVASRYSCTLLRRTPHRPRDRNSFSSFSLNVTPAGTLRRKYRDGNYFHTAVG